MNKPKASLSPDQPLVIPKPISFSEWQKTFERLLKYDADARTPFNKYLQHINAHPDDHRTDAKQGLEWLLDMIYMYTKTTEPFGEVTEKRIRKANLHIRERLNNLSQELKDFAEEIRRAGIIVAPDGGLHGTDHLLQCFAEASIVVEHYLFMMRTPHKARRDSTIVNIAMGLLGWFLYWEDSFIFKPKEACAIAKLALQAQGYDKEDLSQLDVQRETGNIGHAIDTLEAEFLAIDRSVATLGAIRRKE